MFNDPFNAQQMENKRSRLRWFGVAAALMVAVAALVVYRSRSISPETIFRTFYKPEAQVLPKVLDDLEQPGFADPESASRDSLAEALRAYEAFQYDKAQALLQAYLSIHPDDQLAQLYMGLTLVQKNSFREAVAALQPVAQSEFFSQKYTARWYLALSLMQLNRPDNIAEAKSWFQQLKEDEQSGYSREAGRIWQLLDN